MAKKPTEKDKSAEAAGANGAEQTGPMLSVLAQYIKDLSFENPNSPNSLRPREKPPEIKINVNVGATPLSETDFEVELKLEAKAEDGSEVQFGQPLFSIKSTE